jgi:glycosyltransferase involved in cell wall biosynthesis
VLPVKYCAPELAKHDIILEAGDTIDKNMDYQAVILHRIPPPQRLPLFAVLAKRGVKLIWEFDDDLPNIPEWNPFKAGFNDDMLSFLQIYLEMSSKIIVSTDHLKAVSAPMHEIPPEKYVVLKNLIDLDHYSLFWKNGHNFNLRQGNPINVLWSGSYSHVKDLDQIMPVLDYFLKKDNGDIFFTFHGYIPVSCLRTDPRRVVHVSWNTVKHYASSLCMLSPHIALLPLDPHIFNRSKSNIKYLEMTVAGAASISSDINTYTDSIVHGQDGFVAKTTQDWIDYITALSKSRAFRHQIVDKAQQKVLEEFSWQTDNQNKRDWIEFFKSVPDIPI